MEARSIPESERTAKQNYLADEAIYFADNEGDFDHEQVYKYLQDVGKLLDRNELRLLEGMRTQTTPIPDASTTSIYLMPSRAISILLESLDLTFGSANGDSSRLLLSILVPTELDGLVTYVEIEKKIEEVALTKMKKVAEGSGFDLDLSMLDCRNDETMADHVNKLVGEDSSLSTLKEYETATATVAMELAMILVEKQALLGLVSGRLRTYTRENGRLAIWGKVPEWLRKFYCIGTARRYNLLNRVADYRIAEGYEYFVSPNAFEISLLWL
jgi:hypothetical protein